MVFLEQFRFPDKEDIRQWLNANANVTNGYHSDIYPFLQTVEMGLYTLDFEPITLMCGGNGCGKSTVLNIIANKLDIERTTPFNSSIYFDEFVELCGYSENEMEEYDKLKKNRYGVQTMCRIITSDDIFHRMYDKRVANESKIHKSKFLGAKYKSLREDNALPKYLNFETEDNVNEFMNGVRTRRTSFQRFATEQLGAIERTYSNGESALMSLSKMLEHPGLYIFDEPENSLSAEFQIELAKLIEFYASNGNCQFIIATHSPFLMSVANAKIYDFDSYPVQLCNWWETANAQLYFSLFNEHRDKFAQR